MSNPLFSILIANYNNGKYLMEAIDSVRNQTYTHWEIILVDDASTDNSKELYKELEKDNRIHIYYNEENRGCGYTKRRCADLATGELCGFLDPDDALTPDALQIMVFAYKKEGVDCAMFCARYALCDEELNNIYDEENFKIPTYDANSNYLRRECSITHFCVFNRQLYQRTEGISAEMKRAVDQDLYLKMEEIGRKFFIPKILYLYRQQPHSISLGTNQNKALYWHILAIQEACKRRGIQQETEGIVASLLYDTADTAQSHNLQKKMENPNLKYLLYMLVKKLSPINISKGKSHN